MQDQVFEAGKTGEKINYLCRETQLGLMLMAITDKGICSVLFEENETLLLAQLQREFPHATLNALAAHVDPVLTCWITALTQHINQDAPRPDLPLDMRGTAFQIKVWQCLMRIKAGDTLNYAEVAAQIGAPKAARAVGTACAKNRIAVLIPCHRVLRSDGQLGGYRWGLMRKKRLLAKDSGLEL